MKGTRELLRARSQQGGPSSSEPNTENQRSCFHRGRADDGQLHWRARPPWPLAGSCGSSSNPVGWEEANIRPPTESSPQGNLINTRNTENEGANLQAR